MMTDKDIQRFYDDAYGGRIYTTGGRPGGAKTRYYYFDERRGRWFTKVTIEIRNMICERLQQSEGVDERAVMRIYRQVIQYISVMEKHCDDLLEQYTKAHPNLVQFNDIVYDIDTHRVALGHPDFKLKQIHMYDLPLGKLDRSQMVCDGRTFYDLPLDKGAVAEGCPVMLERIAWLVGEDALNFVLAYLGAGFYHDISQFQSTIAFCGATSSGKSFVIEDVVGSYLYSDYISAVGNGYCAIKRSYRHTMMLGQEVNYVNDLTTRGMSDAVVDVLENVQQGNHVNIKPQGIGAYQSVPYARNIIHTGGIPLPPMRKERGDVSPLRSGLVIINCIDYRHKDDIIRHIKRFERQDMVEDIPHFALLCMMVFNEHRQNGNIARFHEGKGTQGGVIEGFLSEQMVQDTLDYFSSL